MSKFKAGDRVRIVKALYGPVYQNGDKGTLQRHLKFTWLVKFTGGEKHAVLESEMERIKTTKDTTRAQNIIDEIRELIATDRREDIKYLIEELPYLVADMEELK